MLLVAQGCSGIYVLLELNYFVVEFRPERIRIGCCYILHWIGVYGFVEIRGFRWSTGIDSFYVGSDDCIVVWRWMACQLILLLVFWLCQCLCICSRSLPCRNFFCFTQIWFYGISNLFFWVASMLQSKSWASSRNKNAKSNFPPPYHNHTYYKIVGLLRAYFMFPDIIALSFWHQTFSMAFQLFNGKSLVPLDYWENDVEKK